MLKRKFLKKIWIAISCLIVIEIISLFPTSSDYIEVNTSTNTGIIYLLDENNYVARLNIIFDATTKKGMIREIVELLTINGSKHSRIRDGFNPVIPEGTRLISFKVENDLVILNFSSKLLKIKKLYEEKMIEAILFSVTSIDGINRVKILVNNTELLKLPNSKKELPSVLDRSFGINKTYDIDSLDNIDGTTIFHLAKKDNFLYYIPVTKVSNENKEKIEIIIDELKSSSTINTNVISYLTNDTKLIDYEILDKSLILNFNDNIFADISSNTISEEVTYTINLSIKENYNIDNVIYYYNRKI